MSWPLADSHRRHDPRSNKLLLAPGRRAPKVMWFLVVAAFLCGGLLSAAGFAVGWKHEAQRGTSAESALVAATATTHSLRSQLASTRASLSAARARSAELGATRRSLLKAKTQLLDELAAARRKVAAVAAASVPLSADLDRLTNELHALTSYVTATPTSQLDAGYLQAQIAYMTKTADGFSSAVAALHPGR